MPIEISTLTASVPVQTPGNRKPAVGDKPVVLLELRDKECWVWDFATGKVCGETYNYDGSPEPWGTHLADMPYFAEVYRHLAEQYAANKGNAVGEFLKYAVDAMEVSLATKIGSVVYFARSGSKVKIGWSRKVAARLAQLQTGNPNQIKLLGFIPGGRARELEIQRQFAHVRVSGEWFEATPELLAYIGTAT